MSKRPPAAAVPARNTSSNPEAKSMCFKSPKAKKAALVGGVLLTAVPAFILGAAFEGGREGQAVHAVDTATSAGSSVALGYLRTKMPNTPWNGVAPDPDMPALYDVSAEGVNQNAVYFDPKRKYLVIGVVVNMENPKQMIGNGHYTGPGADGGVK